MGKWYSYKKQKAYKDKVNKLRPWHRFWTAIRSRCATSAWVKRNRWYKGIKCHLTADDVRFLWKRDKAHKLKHPSVDRIDSRKHYTLKNCRFIERSMNSALSWQFNSTHYLWIVKRKDKQEKDRFRIERNYNGVTMVSPSYATLKEAKIAYFKVFRKKPIRIQNEKH